MPALRFKVKFFLIILSLLFVWDGHAQQDSVLLLNGKVFKGEIGRTHGGIISITRTFKKGKTKTEELASYRVYSFVKGGKSTTVYYQDDLQGNFLSVPEAKNATMGMYDARITYKPRMVFWSSFSLGFGSTLFDTYQFQAAVDDPTNSITEKGFFKGKQSVFPFFVPPVLCGIWAIPKFRVKPKQMLHKQFENDPHYYRGFNRISRQKRVLSSLRGAAIGVASGMLTYYIFN